MKHPNPSHTRPDAKFIHSKEMYVSLKHVFKYGLILVALLTFLNVYVFQAQAQDSQANDLYSIKRVSVKAQAGERTVPKTRDAALWMGEQRALERVISRLVTPASRDRALQLIRDLKPSQIRALIDNYEVVRESVSAIAYEGEITYHFNPDEIRKFFKRHSLNYIERVSSPVVLVMVMRALDTVWIWEETNLWLSFWEGKKPSSPMVPFILAGSAEDRTYLRRRDLLALRQDRLSAVMSSYKLSSETGRILVVALDFHSSDANPFSSLDVRVVEIDNLGQRQRYAISVPEAETLEARLLLAQSLAILAIEDNWKINLPPLTEERSTAQLEIEIRSFQDWLAIRDRLSDRDKFSNVLFHKLSLRDALVSVTYNGSIEGLVKAVAQQTYSYQRDEDSLAKPEKDELQGKSLKGKSAEDARPDAALKHSQESQQVQKYILKYISR